MTKSHILTANTPTRIDVPIEQLTNESKIHLKCGRLVGSNDVTPWKRKKKTGTLKEAIKMTNHFKIDKSIAPKDVQIMQKAPKKAHIEQKAPEEAQILENCDISVSYVHTREKWDRNNIVINNIFFLSK